MRPLSRVWAWCCIWAVGSGCVGGIGLHYTPDPTLFVEPRPHSVTFWGHACFYIDAAGTGIVTDPVWERVYASFHRRYIGSPPDSVFDQTKLILISHAHNDHLSPATLERFPESTVILCPIPSAKYMDKLRLKIITMRPGDEYTFPGGRVVAVTANHPGYRYSYKASTDGRALGYIIETGGHTIYYTGDSEYFEGFRDVGTRFHPDLLLLNVNTHLRPAEALKLVREVNPQKVIPGHFGAYRGSNERKTPAYRGQMAQDLGALWQELPVGGAFSLDSLR